jgi:hypothetical protein
MIDVSRREFLAALGIFAGAAFPVAAIASRGPDGEAATTFDPRKYGAKGDGKALDSGAINAAIDSCTAAGGGIVHVAPGTYRCGIVILKANVTLYLEAGATILGSTNIDDYFHHGGSGGKNDAGQNHLIFAKDAEKVAIRGSGRIDGQGSTFWKRSDRSPLPPDQSWADVIAHGWAPKGKRPSPMLEFVNCTGLRIEDIHIEGAPSWTMRTLNCDQVVIRGISVKNPNYGPNTDGMDICGCSNVNVSDCNIDTGDDAICLKSENPYGGEPLVNKNIAVTNCVLTTCCNGFKLGTTTEGGFENITFTNSVIYNNAVDLAQRVISGIALEVVDGGWIDGVHVSGIKMQRTRTPIFIRLGDRAKKFDYPQHGLRNVIIEDIHATESVLASSITGLENMYVEDVTLKNIQIDSVVAGRSDWVNREVPEVPDKYPEARMFGMLPAFGLYCRHVRGLHLSDIAFRAIASEQRPTMICDDVRGIEISGLSSTPTQGGQPVVKLVECKDVSISHSAAPAGSSAYLSVEGHDSASILLSGCDMRGAKRAIETSRDVPAGAVKTSDDTSAAP